MRTYPPTRQSLAAYSVMAAAFILTARQSDAQIIYHDIVPDDSLEHDGYHPIDFDNNGSVEVGLALRESLYSYRRAYIINEFNGSVAFKYPSGGALQLAAGDVICSPPQLNWDVADWYHMKEFVSLFFYPSSHSSGDWKGGVEDGYVAVNFELPDGTYHYGWIRLSLSADVSLMVIKDYAYNQVPEDCLFAGEGIATGIVPIEKAALKIFPNPAADKIHLLSPPWTDTEVTLFDLSGARLFSQIISGHENTIDISALRDGNYLLKAQSGDKLWIEKFVVNK